MQVMSYLVYGAMFGLGQFSGAGECVFFKEKAYFVTAGEEVVVADMGVLLTGREFSHRMIGKGEGREHIVCFQKEGGDGGGGKGVGDEEVTIVFIRSELLCGELCRYSRALDRRRYA